MRKTDFKVGELIEKEIYTYADSEVNYVRNIKGKVYQITNHFVVIDNGYYKESFQYREFVDGSSATILENPYELDVETYSKEIVKQCVQDVNNGKEGYVFNYKQLGDVINSILPEKYTYRVENNIYFVKKITN